MLAIAPMMPMLMVAGLLMAGMGGGAMVMDAGGAAASAGACDTTTEEPDSGTTPIAPNEAALAVARRFADAGYSKASTAGVLGNLQAESGFDPTAASPDGGYGIAQWTPRDRIRTWMASVNASGSDSDLDIQSRMLVETAQTQFNNHYLAQVEAEGIDVPDGGLYDLWRQTGDPQTAAVAWMAGWERPDWGLRNEQARRDTAEAYYRSGLDSVTFNGRPSTSPDTGGTTAATACGGPAATTGGVAGAPTDTHDFGWMCSTDAHVCRDSDYGPFPFSSYQCYWYALVRLWLIHDHDVENWHTPYGGDIHIHLASDPAYTVDSTPHPGDGVSQFGGALGGDMTAGHVAVVEEVQSTGSGWRIRISEGNYGTDGSGPWRGYNSRWLDNSQFRGAGNVFFRKKSWNN